MNIKGEIDNYLINTKINIEDTDTYREILQQPSVWKKEFDILRKNKEAINNFVSKHFDSNNTEIIFTGAGTSAFIGDILAVLYARKGYQCCKSVSTTDIITHPEVHLPSEKNLVLVSFARSGNSPESVATIDLANKLCKEVVHIVITCNPEGQLATQVSKDDLLILLPPETNDKSLAMTSSFSTMLLTGFLLTEIHRIDDNQISIEELCDNAQQVINSYLNPLEKISRRSFSRAIFLGSGELKGIAEECHLKLQEMTDGKIICKFDTFLGFRHGPKAAINEETLLVYLFSDDEYVFLYERDLVEQINSNNKVVGQIAISRKPVSIPSVNFDLEVVTAPNTITKNNEYEFMIHVIAGQLLAIFKSFHLNFNPDTPSVSGNIARVVEGVKIYEYEK